MALEGKIRQLKTTFKNDPINTMVPVRHCLNCDNCGMEEVAYYHTYCLKYRCPDYSPRHTKNAKIFEKIKLKLLSGSLVTTGSAN